tara:strand:+ start:248 stop:469 length:222 start_codon:yes stop_codon:yes gene_type:complete
MKKNKMYGYNETIDRVLDAQIGEVAEYTNVSFKLKDIGVDLIDSLIASGHLKRGDNKEHISLHPDDQEDNDAL